MTGAPPSLAEAIVAVDGQRSKLAANPSEPELQATIVFSLAADTLPELEERAQAVTALFEPHEYGIFRPTGGQLPLLRSMMPGTVAGGRLQGLHAVPPARRPRRRLALLRARGRRPDRPAARRGARRRRGQPRAARPHVRPPGGAHGVAGRGRRPRLGQVVLPQAPVLGHDRPRRPDRHDRPHGDRRVRVLRPGRARQRPGRAPVERHRRVPRPAAHASPATTGPPSPSASCRCSAGARPTPTRARRWPRPCTPWSTRPTARLGDVIDELYRMGDDDEQPDEAARSLARRLSHYRRLGVGRLAFGDGKPVSLDADCIVFWAPNLALPDRDTLLNEHLARQMLPEQILGQALLYLVAAVGRQVVFRDPSRFGAALYDEAWALLASPHGQRLLLEGVRDGRKHNGAIWLASQHPNDLGIGRAGRPRWAPGSCSASRAGRSARPCGSSAWRAARTPQHVLAQGLRYRPVPLPRRPRPGRADPGPRAGARRAAARLRHHPAERPGRLRRRPGRGPRPAHRPSLPSLSEAEALEEAPPSLPAGEPPLADDARRSTRPRSPPPCPRPPSRRPRRPARRPTFVRMWSPRHQIRTKFAATTPARLPPLPRSRPSRRPRRSPARCRLEVEPEGRGPAGGTGRRAVRFRAAPAASGPARRAGPGPPSPAPTPVAAATPPPSSDGPTTGRRA